MRDEVFRMGRCPGTAASGARDVIVWHRVKDFQLAMLKVLAHAALRLGGPTGHPNRSMRFEDLYVAGELSRRILVFCKPVTVYASRNNPGAVVAAHALRSGMLTANGKPNEAVRVTEAPDAVLRGQSAGALGRAAAGSKFEALLLRVKARVNV